MFWGIFTLEYCPDEADLLTTLQPDGGEVREAARAAVARSSGERSVVRSIVMVVLDSYFPEQRNFEVLYMRGTKWAEARARCLKRSEVLIYIA